MKKVLWWRRDILEYATGEKVEPEIHADRT
jgi:hypothetical protein